MTNGSTLDEIERATRAQARGTAAHLWPHSRGQLSLFPSTHRKRSIPS